MKKKRIAVVTSTFFPAIGGSEIVAYNIALSLRDRGYEPYLLVNFKNYLYFLGKKIDVKLLPLPPLILSRLERNPSIVLFLIRRIFSLYQLLFNFQHWYANTGYPAGIITSNFCSKYQYKCTLRCGGEDIQVLRRINYGFRINNKIDLLIKKYYPRFTRLIAINKKMIQDYKDVGVLSSKISLLPNPVYINYPNNKEASINKASVFTFIAVGRNHIKKDFSTLIYALPILKSISNLEFKVIFIGNGYNQIKHLVNKLEISHLVRFKFISHKKISDYRNLKLPSQEMVKMYQTSHCLISPSLIEGFPNAVAEAMSFGLPVIGSNTPGNQDLIKDNITGLLFEAGDSENLAYAMKRLLEDKKKLMILGKSGQASSNNWSFEIVSDLYLKTFGLKK
jgi:glycosyltransferase involved in cell wall biosynthesis